MNKNKEEIQVFFHKYGSTSTILIIIIISIPWSIFWSKNVVFGNKMPLSYYDILDKAQIITWCITQN